MGIAHDNDIYSFMELNNEFIGAIVTTARTKYTAKLKTAFFED